MEPLKVNDLWEEKRKRIHRNMRQSLQEIWVMTQRALEGLGIAPLEDINEIAKKGLGLDHEAHQD